ncbi:Eco57I restriction-modification methylase domain-containing protein [Segatella copri]|uniref:Eco57I restriction-modification methylase domain-containing protein n=1 Tax=Segatella copri TaxID=165179 RepID=UPI001C47461F|nr:Eco57I restriction-modification methylase domain-containing protein [Segatella copri]MBW0026843.1 Eco57I restriction-modification methylase domain-containing protein [Segatella copri]
MATYSTLEEIKTGMQDDLFADDFITLRSEQRDAIDQAKERFCKRSGRRGEYQYEVLPEYRQFLWNAKMRFGKTICAMQLMRELDVKRTLIITHRPVVGESWLQAFKQVVGSKSSEPKVKGNSDIHKTYGFGMRSDDESETVGNYYDLESFVETPGNHYAFFVSMQYIRLSELVNSKTQAKNAGVGNTTSASNEKLKADILKTDWDLIIIDEAHEGTLTSLGKGVIQDFLKKEKTKMLYLSGTPFNLYEDFKEDEIYTWDYIAEQTAKHNWDLEHPNGKNPYAELPKMNIFTYDITKNIDNILDQTGVFSFPEFFRTWTGNPKADNASMPEGAKGRFVHEPEVSEFLDLLCKKDAENNFPFSTNEYRQMFRHTLWVVSHVNEAAALEQLLKEHKIFRHFTIVNVAGRSETDEQNENALDKVLKAIGDNPEKTSTITISCGRLTTGVTVAPWTAVFYLKGGDRAATYMQTIFRVQSPYKTHEGKIKKECYVFDFAPDRALKIVAETAKFSSMATAKEKKKQEGDEEKTQEMRDKETVREFIELCPVLSMDGGKMSPMDVNDIYKQLENVFIDRLVRKGFDDPCLYNQDELNKVNPEIINHIGEHGGKAPDEKRKDASKSVDLSHMTPEERAEWEENKRQKIAEAKKKAEEKLKKDEEFKAQWEAMSDEEREDWLKAEAERIARREKAKEEREEFKKRMTNIRGIALRIPLLMYGGADAGDPKDELTVDNFTRKIKDESWTEFMPKGISKEDFNKIRKCFNATRFEEAGKKYRALTREADFMHIDERIRQITEIFSYFRNPDKETVLTPWRVVNMHMSDTIGGWCWYDESFDEKTGMLCTPRYVDQGDVTRQLFDNVDLAGEVQTKILEINSKTGLYPLYVTYSLFRRRLEEYIKAECIEKETVSVQEEQVVWDDIVENNMYVICNTPMAKGITHRTLFGFRQVDQKANIKNVQLIERASKDQEGLVKELKSVGFWKGNSSKQEMKFNAVVGNPPYQIMDGGGTGSSATPIYNKFVDLAKLLNPNNVSMIIPAKWYTGGKGLDEFRANMLNDKQLIKLFDYEDSRDCFPTVDIAGGVCYFLWNKGSDNKCVVTSILGSFRNESTRYLNEHDTFIRNQKVLDIINKVKSQTFTGFLSQTVYSRKPFGIRSFQRGFPAKPGRNISLFGSDGITYMEEKDVPQNKEIVDKWKVIRSKASAEHAGQTDANGRKRIVSRLEVLPPYTICTESYLLLDIFDNEEEAQNLKKYIRTCFTRFLLASILITQNIVRDKFKFVPIQNYKNNSDIDWSQSIPDIDRQLYTKYNLSDDEIAFIEKMIKPMD